MNKTQAARMQVNTAIGIASREPVFQISLNRAPDRRELGPDLVVSPCF